MAKGLSHREVTSSCEGSQIPALERLEVGAIKTRGTKPESTPLLSRVQIKKSKLLTMSLQGNECGSTRGKGL